MTNGKLRVELAWQREPEKDGLENALADVEVWLQLDPDFWESVADMDEWIGRMRECRSMEELVSIFR
jgi:hypothetical protein